MHRLISALIFPVALAGLVQGTSLAAVQRHTHVSPKRFVLTRADVPRSFHQVVARSLTDAEADQADRLPPGTFARRGRITSYETAFLYSGRQYAWLEDNVVTFTSVADAHWEFVRLVMKGRKPLGGQPFQRMQVGHLGDESAGFVYSQILGRFPVICGIAIFRQGSYAAWVVSCGLTAGYSVRVSPALAHIIDGRIRSAVRLGRTAARLG